MCHPKHPKPFAVRSSFACVILSLMTLFLTMTHAGTKEKMVHDSVITLPIEANLTALETYINDMVPEVLAKIDEPDRTCIQAQYLKTKGFPNCRIDGLKISCKSRTIKIRTFPKIKCDVDGWVKRNGRITVSGQDKTLKFAFPVKARVSTDLGILETANASAIFYVYATPKVHEDWRVTVDIAPHFVWSEKPTLTLLNTIKINIQDKVEPKLRKKIEDYVKKVPQLLASLNMKEKVNTVWQGLQDPIKIKDSSETYLVFKPKMASYSGFSIVDNVLRATVSAQGKTDIILGKPDTKHTKTQLCDLNSTTCEEGRFNFHLPVSITYKELLDLSKKNHFHTQTVDLARYALPGVVHISKPKIIKSGSSEISITAHLRYDNRSQWLKKIDLFNWFEAEGEITFKGTPRIDTKSRILLLDNLVYDSTTNNELFDALVHTSRLQPLQSYFSNLIQFEFGQKIDDDIANVNKAFKMISKDDMHLSSQLQVASIDNVIVNETYITFNTNLSGKVNASIGL